MIGHYTKLHGDRWGLFDLSDDYSFREKMGCGLYRRLQVCEKVLWFETLYVMSYSQKMPEFIIFRTGESLIPGCP